LDLLRKLRESSETAYQFQMHLMNEVYGLGVPDVLPTNSQSFSVTQMCPGFVFVPKEPSGAYGANLPAQLIRMNSEASVPFGNSVDAKGGSFYNGLENYRLPCFEEIVAMFYKRPVTTDARLF
jgi:hypothetical protein